MSRLAWLLIGLIALLGGPVRPAAALLEVETLSALPARSAAHGLAIGPDGLLYVGQDGDDNNGSILVYRLSGSLVDEIRVRASSTGVVSLRGLAFDRSGNLYVADAANGRDGRGRIVKIDQHRRQSTFADGLTAPTALAFDHGGVLYIGDDENGAVVWIGPDGASAPFVEDDRLRSEDGRGGVSGLVFAPDDRALYISIRAADRVLRLSVDADGAAGRLRVFADRDSLRHDDRDGGLLDGPAGLAIDSRGNLLVAASRGDEVEVFSPEGRLLDRVRGGDGRLSAPGALAVTGRWVYVVDRAGEDGAPRLSRFSLFSLSDD